jgi:phage portal protein BeeE
VGLLERISERRGGGRKSWSQSPFWELDAARFPLFGSFARDQERIENDFESFVQGAYKGSGPVFAAIDRRQQVFSQVSFQWQRMRGSRPGELVGSEELRLLEEPWPNGTTGELLAHMESDASIAGNFFATTVDESGRIGRAARRDDGRRIARMRPDWVTMVIDAPSGNPWGIDARVVGYMFSPPENGGRDPLILLPSEVVHYSPKPDPVARFRGMSWLTPIIKEVMGDRAATDHKLRFFENGALHSVALKYPPGTTIKQLREAKGFYDAEHRGGDNAYKALFIAGADPVPMSMDFRQMDFKVTQGAGETRVATASGVPAAILGISEGLAGSSLNAGNFGAARRLFVDTTIRDLWAKAAPSLQVLLTSPGRDVRLWYDDRDIPFLREDARDDADIRNKDAQTLRELVDAGWEPDAAVGYIRAGGDLSVLVGHHSGRFSVQLQTQEESGLVEMPALDGVMNGSGSGR